MSYVEGETLGERLRRAGPLPAADATRVLREVAWALAYAHGRGIVHRDVKPDNILLEAGTGRALVTDFGIAHAPRRCRRHAGRQDHGDRALHEPRAGGGEPVDGRSDLYALGVTAFFALSGRLPFESSTAAGYLHQHRHVEPPPVASIRPGLPPPLAAVVDRCLAKSPAERFPTAEALADALARRCARYRRCPGPCGGT